MINVNVERDLALKIPTIQSKQIDENDDDDDDDKKDLIISTDEDQHSVSSPLDLSTSDHLSSTSFKSDEEQQIPSTIQFQMEDHEGEPEDPNMAKVKTLIFSLFILIFIIIIVVKRYDRTIGTNKH